MNNHHLISANRLDDGAVVWLDEAFEWVDTLGSVENQSERREWM